MDVAVKAPKVWLLIVKTATSAPNDESPVQGTYAGRKYCFGWFTWCRITW